MEIIRNIALYAGWGFVAVLALFAIGVAFMLIQSRNKAEEKEPKGQKSKRSFVSKKPKKAESLVQKVSQVSREESSQRILGDSTPLPSRLPTLQGLPTQTPAPQPARIQLPQMTPSAQPASNGTETPFVNLPSRLPDPPQL